MLFFLSMVDYGLTILRGAKKNNISGARWWCHEIATYFGWEGLKKVMFVGL